MKHLDTIKWDKCCNALTIMGDDGHIEYRLDKILGVRHFPRAIKHHYWDSVVISDGVWLMLISVFLFPLMIPYILWRKWRRAQNITYYLRKDALDNKVIFKVITNRQQRIVSYSIIRDYVDTDDLALLNPHWTRVIKI